MFQTQNSKKKIGQRKSMDDIQHITPAALDPLMSEVHVLHLHLH